MQNNGQSYNCCLYRRILFAIFVICLNLFYGITQAALKGDDYALEFMADGKLSLDAAGIALETILADIRANTQLKFSVSEKHLKIPISVSFRSLPMQEAMKRILHGISYACILSRNGVVEQIITVADDAVFDEGEPEARQPAESASHEILRGQSFMHSDQSEKVQVLPPSPPEVMDAIKMDIVPVPPPGLIAAEN